MALARRLPPLTDGRLGVGTLSAWAAEFDELSGGKRYTAGEFVEWRGLELTDGGMPEFRSETAQAGAYRRWRAARVPTILTHKPPDSVGMEWTRADAPEHE